MTLMRLCRVAHGKAAWCVHLPVLSPLRQQRVFVATDETFACTGGRVYNLSELALVAPQSQEYL